MVREGASQKTVSSEGRDKHSQSQEWQCSQGRGQGGYSLCKGPGAERDCGLLKRQQGQPDKVKRGRRLKSISHRAGVPGKGVWIFFCLCWSHWSVQSRGVTRFSWPVPEAGRRAGSLARVGDVGAAGARRESVTEGHNTYH